MSGRQASNGITASQYYNQLVKRNGAQVIY